MNFCDQYMHNMSFVGVRIIGYHSIVYTYNVNIRYYKLTNSLINYNNLTWVSLIISMNWLNENVNC